MVLTCFIYWTIYLSEVFESLWCICMLLTSVRTVQTISTFVFHHRVGMNYYSRIRIPELEFCVCVCTVSACCINQDFDRGGREGGIERFWCCCSSPMLDHQPMIWICLLWDDEHKVMWLVQINTTTQKLDWISSVSLKLTQNVVWITDCSFKTVTAAINNSRLQ